MSQNWIDIRGAKQNNLKNLDLRIPLNALTVITGVSGSGKSTLAFDILYAEGQRRYVESFSTYTRQFLERMEKPDVERISGIQPAAAIDQRRPVTTSRSTVGTMTELHDHLKVLFANLGVLHCRQCGRAVVRDTPPAIARALLSQRLVGSLEQALKYGKGRATLIVPATGERRDYSATLECADCGITYRDATA